MRSGLVIASVVAALLVLSAQAGATKPQPTRVKYTPSPVMSLALDGSRAAYISGGRVYVWNVATGATSTVKGRYPDVGKPRGVPAWAKTVDHEVAIAGTRVAFAMRFVVEDPEAPNDTRARLYVAPVGGWAHRIGPVYRSHDMADTGAARGSYVAGPIGSGDLLAASTWNSDVDNFDEQLRLITPSGLHTIVAGQDAIVAESASGGRIAVLVSSSFPLKVRIYARTGALLGELVPTAPREIALSGKQLVVLTSKNTVEVYDWTTGDLLHTWAIAKVPPNAHATHLAAYGRLAVYAIDAGYEAPRTLRLLDLETGRDVAIVRARGGYKGHDAAMGPRGLVNVVTCSTRDRPHHLRGKITFVPMAELLNRVSRP